MIMIMNLNKENNHNNDVIIRKVLSYLALSAHSNISKPIKYHHHPDVNQSVFLTLPPTATLPTLTNHTIPYTFAEAEEGKRQ